MQTPRVHKAHIGFMRRLAKNYSATRTVCFIYGITFVGFLKFLSKIKSPVEEEDKRAPEVYNRLLTLYKKNKFGYHTRIFADFDTFLEAMLNERFIDDSSGYYDDAITSKEIEDVELGLNGDLSEADVKHLLKDKDGGHHANAKCFKHPGRFGTNYEVTDDLSIYKVHPKGFKP